MARLEERGAPPAETARYLKERVYASFTGLSVVTVLALNVGHTSPPKAFVTLLAGIVGISLAGFVADLIGYQVVNSGLPPRAEVTTMARIASSALGSASVALIAIAVAWVGWIPLELALRISVGIYIVTLALIALVAVTRTGLPWHQRLIALGLLVGLGAIVVLVLIVAHGG